MALYNVKASIAIKGKYIGEKFNEYCAYTSQEAKEINKVYSEKQKELINFAKNPKTSPYYFYKTLPPIEYPKIKQDDIDKKLKEFQDKGFQVIDIVKKHNGNIQIYFKEKKGVKNESGTESKSE